MAVPPGAPDSISITSPSSSSMIGGDRHIDVSHRFGRHPGVPSPVKELNLNASLPPTPEFSRFPNHSSSYPLSPHEYPSRSPTSAVFPGTARRKTSSASQHPPHPRTSVASTASSGSLGGNPMPPPALPIRSPLRKHSNKSLASFTGLLHEYNLAESSPVPLPPSPTTSIPIAGSSSGPNLNGRETPSSRIPPSRPLPRKPSRNSISSLTSDTYVNTNPSVISLTPTTQEYSSNTATPAASGSSPSLSGTLASTVVNEGASDSTKRRHALIELLTTERSYAADLTVVKEIHIPLARGQQCRFQPKPPPPLPKDTPPLPNGNPTGQSNGLKSQPPSLSSRRSSAHTTSTVSSTTNASTAPSSSTSLPQPPNQNKIPTPSDSDLPMTYEASKIVFGNIEEIAQFANDFTESLELALGDVLEGGQGKDTVGALFLEVIPQIAERYKTYITRHPAALAQFQSLPQCTALTAYLAETKALADPHTHAWDIPSLLIKPVQRLLKYPLLIGQIISCTPDDHPDKANLIQAKDRIEEVARTVNEGRRRWEVVKAVLARNSGDAKGSKDSASSASNGLAPPRPKVGRMRSFRSKVKPSVADSDSEKAKDEMEEWEKRLKECEMACKELAKGSLQWCRDVQFCFKKLKAWNACFGNVVGLGEHGVEAVGAFGKVVSGLQTLWTDLDNTLQTVLLPQLSKLIGSLSSPQILLAHMHTLYHSHVTLLNTPYNKSRPPNTLLEASQDFLALRATLREELPLFFFMFEKGLGLILVEFSRWQGRLYREVKDRWMQFWVALAIDDGDANPEGVISGIGSGAAETVGIWRERFEEVEEILMSFKTMKRPVATSQVRSKSQPHLPQAPLQVQLPPQGTLPPNFPRTASGTGMYRHKNGSASSVGDSGRVANHQVYQRPTHSQSAHALQTPIDDREKRFWEFNGDFGPFPDLRAKSPPPPVTRGPAIHMRNGSGDIDALRAKDIALTSIVPNVPVPQTKPSKREKSRDREKDREREREKERLEKEKRLEKERVEKEKKQEKERLERERKEREKQKEKEARDRELEEKARALEREERRMRESQAREQQRLREQARKQAELEQQAREERERDRQRQEKLRDEQKKQDMLKDQDRRRENERTFKEKERERLTRDSVKAPRLNLRDLRPRERMRSEGSISLPQAHEYHGDTSSFRSKILSPPSPSPSARPLSPVSPSRLYRRSKEKSRDLDDDTASIRSTSSRAFRRRITDTFLPRPPHSRSNSIPPGTPVPGAPAMTPLPLPAKPPVMTSNKADILADPASLTPPRHVNIHRRGHSTEDVFAPLPSLPLHHPVEPPLSASFPDHLDPPPSPLYSCTTIVPFLPPPDTPHYMNLPMLRLHVGDTIEVLHEAGHPSHHALPFQVDDGDDCILLARDETGHIGWAFASFVIVTT
ncbi:hypothetical protein FRC02_008415 [Tulasnella sp. 418]|nr:hypothetical protein FRC02_008415 [Tulasnella sp. 418]